MATYDIGDVVRCTGTFTDADGNAQDPSGVIFRVEDPSGNEMTYIYGTDAEVIKTATGIYYVDVTIDEAGYWHYRFEGTGTGASGGESYFTVRSSQF